jgi:hypothetical protein
MANAIALFDRVLVTSTTTGTGSYALGGAVTAAFRDFTGIPNGTPVGYSVWEVDGSGNPTGGYEDGIGTVSSSGTVLARTQVNFSSNGNAAVNWSAGTRHIVVAAPSTGMQAAINATYDTGHVHIANDGSTTETVIFGVGKISTSLTTAVRNSKSWWASTKYTPLVAGVHRFKGVVTIAAVPADSYLTLLLYKNGVEAGRGQTACASSSLSAMSASVEDDIELNGSTDYVELYAAYTDSALTNRSTFAGATLTYFKAHYVGLV